MSDSAAVLRQRVIFRGRVQGVGFRATTASIARRHPVVGYVKNMPDGSVELVAEAEPAALDQFIADLATTFARYIRQQEAHEVPRDEAFSKFEVRR